MEGRRDLIKAFPTWGRAQLLRKRHAGDRRFPGVKIRSRLVSVEAGGDWRRWLKTALA